jgi:hypothetical protein
VKNKSTGETVIPSPRKPLQLRLDQLRDLARRVHTLNRQWWHDINTDERLDRNVGELLMLVVSELSEALEGHRKNLQDDHLPRRKMFEVELADVVIRVCDVLGSDDDLMTSVKWIAGSPLPRTENAGESLLRIVQSVIRAYEAYDPQRRAALLFRIVADVEILADSEGCDLYGAIEEKLAYNARREDHKAEVRRAEHGKKY